jgi:hypothetical protein
LLGIKRLALLPARLFIVAIVAVSWLSVQPRAQAQAQAQDEAAASRGENFSAKPAPALFASDCTGGGCHKGPQGLAKGQSQGSLAGFLREHYTNSRESAAALAAYLVTLPSGPAPSEVRAPKPQPSARSSRAAVRSDETPAKPSARAQSGSRAQRARQSAAPPPPEPPAPEPPKQFDIFD